MGIWTMRATILDTGTERALTTRSQQLKGLRQWLTVHQHGKEDPSPHECGSRASFVYTESRMGPGIFWDRRDVRCTLARF